MMCQIGTDTGPQCLLHFMLIQRCSLDSSPQLTLHYSQLCIYCMDHFCVIKCTLEKETCIRCRWAWLFITALSYPTAFFHSSIHPTNHSANHPLFLLMCVFYQIFVCSPLILHAASALLPLPNGILSGKHNSYWISMDWHSVKLYCDTQMSTGSAYYLSCIMVMSCFHMFKAYFCHLDAWDQDE